MAQPLGDIMSKGTPSMGKPTTSRRASAPLGATAPLLECVHTVGPRRHTDPERFSDLEKGL